MDFIYLCITSTIINYAICALTDCPPRLQRSANLFEYGDSCLQTFAATGDQNFYPNDCVAKGGFLATIHDSVKNEIIRRRIGGAALIGAFFLNSRLYWINSGNEPFDYKNFFSKPWSPTDCTSMTSSDGKWWLERCVIKYRTYLCEFRKWVPIISSTPEACSDVKNKVVNISCIVENNQPIEVGWYEDLGNESSIVRFYKRYDDVINRYPREYFRRSNIYTISIKTGNNYYCMVKSYRFVGNVAEDYDSYNVSLRDYCKLQKMFEPQIRVPSLQACDNTRKKAIEISCFIPNFSPIEVSWHRSEKNGSSVKLLEKRYNYLKPGGENPYKTNITDVSDYSCAVKYYIGTNINGVKSWTDYPYRTNLSMLCNNREMIKTAFSTDGMFTDVLLPMGNIDDFFVYNIEVHINVTELEGFELIKTAQVLVMIPVNAKLMKKIVELIKSKGDHTKAAKFASIVVQLNITETEIVEVTEHISDLLSVIEYTNGYAVLNPVSEAVFQITKRPETLTQKSMDNLSDCLYKLSTYYANSSVPEFADRDRMLAFTDSLLNSFSTIYGLTVDDNMATNGTEVHKTTTEKASKLLNIVENLAAGVMNAMNDATPEKIEFVTTEMNIVVGVANNSEQTVVNSSREINNKTFMGSFNIPILPNSKQPSYKFQMLFTEKIPFFTSNITTPMLSLKIKDQNRMPVEDFPEPIIISLPNDEEELFTVYTWNSLCKNGVGMLNSDRFLRLYVNQPANQYFMVKLKLQIPVPILYAIHMKKQVTFANAQNGTLLTDMFTAFIKDPEETPLLWSIGLLFAEQECRENVSINVSVSTSSISCQYWNSEFEIWSTTGCQVLPLSTGQNILCKCSHLSHFAGGFFVLPNFIDPIADSLLFLTFFDNPVIVSTVILLWMTYLFVLVWARRADIKDTEFGITIPYPSNMDEPYKYLMCIVTGWRFKSGTSAHVSCYIIGSKGQSAKHGLSVHNRVLFQSGAEDWFIITSSFDLGKPMKIVFWHDSSGASPSWFLSRVTLQDMQSTEVYSFFHENWIGEESGQVKVQLECISTTKVIKTYFGQQFFLKTNEDLRKNHLWISIFAKPPSSEFTRAQRLSCALSLLLCTMLTCLMFHGIPDDDEITTNIAGFSFEISLQDLVIGIESGLIMFPVNLIILQLFLRSKRKRSKRRERYLEFKNHNLSADVKQTETECKRSRPITNQGRMLPWWILYIAWTVVIVTSLVSSYFVMLYGLKYGYTESLKWLVSFLIGFIDDVCVLEPLNVVLFAMISTFILKKPVTISEGPSLKLNEHKTDYKGHPSATITNPVPKQKLRVSKYQHELEAKIQTKIYDIILYLFFMLVLLIVVHNQRSVELCYRQTKVVEELFVQKEFYNIKTQEHFWTYLNTSLMDRLQKVLLGDVTKKTPENDFFLLGKFRLRQIRIEREMCSFPGQLNKLFTVDLECTSSQSLNYDTRHYNKSWDIPFDAVTTNDEWTYQSAWDLESPPYIGIKSIYSGGGYVVELKPGRSSILKLSSLSKNSWMDPKTIVIIVEFNLFNPNVNLFSNVMMSVEASSHGNLLTSHHILTGSLYHYFNVNDKIKLVLDLIFILLTILFTFFEVKKVVHVGFKPYFKGFWNKLSMFQFILCYTLMGVYVQRVISTDIILKRRREVGNEIFMNFIIPILWDYITVYVMAILVAVSSVKFIKLLTLNSNLNYLYSVFRITKGPLVYFAFMFIISLLAFALTGNLMFGTVLADFRNVGYSILTLIGFTIRSVNSFKLIIDLQPVIGPIFLFVFIFAFVICFMKLFTVILINGVKTLNASKETPTTYTPLLLSYVFESLKRFFR